MSGTEKKIEIVIETEIGRVVGVYSTDPMVKVRLFDTDTTSVVRIRETRGERRELNRRMKAGELVPVDFRSTR